MSKRFAFVNYGNSREGSAIADALKEEGYFVYATRRPDPQKLDHLYPDPLSVDQFIDSDTDVIVTTMRTCHAIIYHIYDTPKVAIETLTKLSEDIGVRKTIIICSPIFTWAGEPRAEDWKKRWAHPNYVDHLGAERYLTSLPLRLYVMCTGLLYGDGEGVMLSIFQSAWNLKPVPILMENRNVIPTLHVKDMARGAVAMISNRPSVPVIVAHDGVRVTQRELIKSINSTFGAGKTRKMNDDDVINQLGREVIDWLKLDIELEAEEFSVLDFERHCGGGPVEEMQTLVDEFVAKRLLTPLRIAAFNLEQSLVDQIVEYYGVVHATEEKLREIFDKDDSEDAIALREAAESEQKEPTEEEDLGSKKPEVVVPINDVMRHVLSTSPLLRNLGYILTSMPKKNDEREMLFMDDDEVALHMPKYILTSEKITPNERWFISRGSHCCVVKSFDDVKKFLGLPKNFSREVKIVEARRRLEALQSEQADEQRKLIKRRKEAEEAKRQKMIERDEELLKECEAELDSMTEIRKLNAKEFLFKYIVPMFKTPLAQINEARPDDPIRFLASHFDTEANRLQNNE